MTLPHERLAAPLRGFAPPPLPAGGTAVLCATAGEARRAAALTVEHIVALAPDAAHGLLVAGVAHLALEDLYDVTLWRDLDEELLAFQGAWADRADRRAWEEHGALRASGLAPAAQDFFVLKVLADSLMRAAVELAHMLLALRPERIVAFAAPDEVPPTLFFPGGAHRAVVPLLGVEVVTEPAQDAPPAPPAPPSRRAMVRDEVARLRRDGLGPRLSALAGAVRGADVVYQGGYDVDLTVARLRREGVRAIPSAVALRTGWGAPATALGPDWPQLGARLRDEPAFAEAFTWAGLDLRPAAESRLRAWWEQRVPEMWQAAARAEHAFARRPPKAVLTYSPWSAEDLGVLHAARRRAIPAATFQHGGFEGNCEYVTYRRTDLRHAGHRLAYGEATAAYCNALGTEATTVAVGSPRLDVLARRPDRRAATRERLGVRAGERVVLYVPNNYQHTWYLARQGGLPVDSFRLLAGVVDVVARVPATRFVYKPFPEEPPDPIPRLLAARAPHAITVRDIPVPDLIQAADGVVLDLPSTALLETVLGETPVLVLADDRFVTLRDEARIPLGRRALLTETPAAFLGALEGFLADPGPPLADRAFVRAYATRDDDGASALRAADAVRRIASSRSPIASSE